MGALFTLLVFIFITVTIISCCCYIKKKKQPLQAIYTTTIETTYPVPLNNAAPYPTQPTIMPQPMQTVPINYPGPYQPVVCPPQPGFIPQSSYPTYPMQNANLQQNPPSYAEATNAYSQQAPYNPNFN